MLLTQSQSQQPTSFPWLIELANCASTNTWALENLSGLVHGDCVWTKDQRQGRGQAGRSWYSDSGVLTASFVIELGKDLLGPLMSMCAGLAIAHCVEDLCQIGLVQIKWPNDCFVGGRKLAGVLCEGRRHAERFAMVIGIGLNVDPHWQQAPSTSLFNGRAPISMRELGNKKITAADKEMRSESGVVSTDSPSNTYDMLNVLKSLRGYLLEAVGLIKAQRWHAILPSLRKRDCLLGSHIQIQQDQRHTLGIGAGIDDDGALLLRLPDGGCISCTSSFNLRVLDTQNAYSEPQASDKSINSDHISDDSIDNE